MEQQPALSVVNTVSDLKQFINNKYLNPLKCDLSLAKCDTFIYFAIGMVLLFSAVILFSSHKYSNIGLLITIMCICVISTICSVIILNMCSLKYPPMYSYAVIAFSVALIFVAVFAMRKN